MSEELVARARNAADLEDILTDLGLVRADKSGFPQDGRFYLGRDGLSVWRQKGPRPFTSTADVFEFLEEEDATKP